MLDRLLAPRAAAALVLLGAAATIAGAFYFEHVLGYVPCKLCLAERMPYYFAMPLAATAALAPTRLSRFLLGLIALVLLYGVYLGIYHAGAEWAFWAGPSDCGGGSGAGPADVGNFLNELQTKQVVDCSVAAWRFLGLSLAGWNAVIAATLALIAAIGALRPARPSHRPGRSPRG